MINELIGRASGATGLSPDQARAGLAAALSLISKHGDEAKTGELFSAIPGSEGLAQEGDAMTAQKSGGLLGGLMKTTGGASGAAMSDAMALGPKLAKQGVTLADMQNILPVAMQFVREKTGRDLLHEVLGSIPGIGGMLTASS